MKFLKKTKYNRIYEIPEIVVFGKNLFTLQHRHTELITNNKDVVPSNRNNQKYLADLSIIDVNESDENWNDSIESQLTTFISNWNLVIPNLKKSVFEHYKQNYDQNLELWFDEPEADFIVMPEPNNEEVVTDLFNVGAVHLTLGSEYVGISGNCTWEEEHGFGAIIHKDQVFEVASADIAYDPEKYAQYKSSQ